MHSEAIGALLGQDGAAFDATDPKPSVPSLVHLLRARAAEMKAAVAYRFLDDRGRPVATFSFAQLDGKARAIAAELQRRTQPGDRVLLLYPPGLEFIAAYFGCLYAGTVAVPWYPPLPNQLKAASEKLRGVSRDCEPRVVLTDDSARALVAGAKLLVSELRACPLLATTRLEEDHASSWTLPDLGASTLAFLQYTSGSTSVPKGVMVTHGNLLANLEGIHSVFEHSRTSCIVSWLPPYHDMGLIGGILQSCYGGFSSVLMSPMTFLKRPYVWLKVISDIPGEVTSGGPNFAYDLSARRITPEQKASLDLSRWTNAFNGAEPIRTSTLDTFAAAFETCGFRREAYLPCYGLAEATLMVSGKASSTSPRILSDRRLVSSGTVLAGHEVRIVDPETRVECAAGATGEIWVRGPSVTAGYFRREQQTADAFCAEIDGTGPYLRTGDLGFLAAGELYVTGRLKDLVIVNGRNHHPQDVEKTIEGVSPLIRPGCCAVFSVTGEAGERVIAVAEARGTGRARFWRRPAPAVAEPVFTAIDKAVLEEHGIELDTIEIVQPKTIAKTTSGKLRRRECRERFVMGRLSTVQRWRRSDGRRIAAPRIRERMALRRFFWFVPLHVGVLVGLFFAPWSPKLGLICLGMYALQVFGVTAGYHRYFAHRSYETGRVFQFCLAVLGSLGAQGGVLWWASTHRHHHAHSDEVEDIHSPRVHGFWQAHFGWVLVRRYQLAPLHRVKDLCAYEELVWLNRNHWVPPLLAGFALWALGGPAVFFWGFMVSTVLVWQMTFAVNSVCHKWGPAPYPTKDCSRNNWLLGILAMGDGWHNNHHFSPRSARHGFRWWQLDVTFLLLNVLAAVGVVRNLVPPNRRTSEAT